MGLTRNELKVGMVIFLPLWTNRGLEAVVPGGHRDLKRQPEHQKETPLGAFGPLSGQAVQTIEIRAADRRFIGIIVAKICQISNNFFHYILKRIDPACVFLKFFATVRSLKICTAAIMCNCILIKVQP